MRYQAPLIIGGTGGSGTRAVQMLFEQAEFFMGSNLNDSRDYLALDGWLSNTVPTILEELRCVDYAPEALADAFLRPRLKRLKELSLQAKSDAPAKATGWGWKHPRSIYLLPLLARIHPNLRYVHVVRDGRDMALSSNQQQLKAFYKHLYGRSLPTNKQAEHLASIAMWQKVNVEATRFASQHFGKRYAVLRYEDFCSTPEASAEALFTRLGLSEAYQPGIARGVEAPASIGRHKALDAKTQSLLADAGRVGLAYFGYLPL